MLNTVNPRFCLYSGSIIFLLAEFLMYSIQSITPGFYDSPVLIFSPLGEEGQNQAAIWWQEQPYYIAAYLFMFFSWRIILQMMNAVFPLERMSSWTNYFVGAFTVFGSQVVVYLLALYLPNIDTPVLLFLPLTETEGWQFNLWAQEQKYYIAPYLVFLTTMILAALALGKCFGTPTNTSPTGAAQTSPAAA